MALSVYPPVSPRCNLARQSSSRFLNFCPSPTSPLYYNRSPLSSRQCCSSGRTSRFPCPARVHACHSLSASHPRLYFCRVGSFRSSACRVKPTIVPPTDNRKNPCASEASAVETRRQPEYVVLGRVIVPKGTLCTRFRMLAEIDDPP